MVERNALDVSHSIAIDPHRAGLKGMCDACGARRILRENGGAETEFGVVCPSDRLRNAQTAKPLYESVLTKQNMTESKLAIISKGFGAWVFSETTSSAQRVVVRVLIGHGSTVFPAHTQFMVYVGCLLDPLPPLFSKMGAFPPIFEKKMVNLFENACFSGFGCIF